MKKMTSFLKPLAVAVVLLAGVSQANAAPALAKFSTTPARDAAGVVIGGTGGTVATGALPAWFQGVDGVAVKPCLDVARCLAAGAPNFTPPGPPSYPTNFPSEAFYFNATANFTMPGASDVLVVMALEYTFLDALGNLVAPVNVPTASGNPFQRLRLVHTFFGGGGNIPFPAGSNFTVTTPWGIATFPAAGAKCVNQGGDTKCTMTRDQPVAGPNPTAALGDPVLAPASISTFLKDPTAPAGFLGLGAAALSYTGGVGGVNTVTVTDPLGNTSGAIAGLKILMGQIVGLEITPPAGGINFGPVSSVVPPAPAAVPKTFIVNNLTGAPVPALAITYSDPEFTTVPTGAVVAPATNLCGATMAIAEICNFYVTFTPNATDGVKTATISIAGGPTVPTALATVTGTADSTPPAITPPAAFARASNPVLSGTVEAGARVQVGTAPATVTGTTWSIKLPSLLTGANTINLTATDAAGNQTLLAAPVTGVIPDGKVATPNAATAVSIADAQIALKFVSGLSALTDEQKVHADVAPLIGGKPVPNDKLDIGDVVLILRKVVAPDSWTP